MYLRFGALALALLALAPLALGAVACRSHEPDAGQLASSVVSKAVSVAAPADLVGQVQIVGARALWSNLRPLSPPALAPLNPEILLAGLLGLPVLTADSLVLEAPIHGVVLRSGEKSSSLWGIKLRRSGEFLALLTSGSAAPFVAEKRGTGDALLRQKADPEALLLMVKGNTLLAGSDRATLVRGSQYLLQLMDQAPTLPPGMHFEFNQLALKRGLIEPLRKGWEVQQNSLRDLMQTGLAAHGHPADLADPKGALGAASLAVEKLLGLASGLNAIKVWLLPTTDGAKIELQMQTAPGSPAQAFVTRLKQCDGEPLGDLPVDVRVAWLSCNDELSPEVFGSDVATQVSALFAERVSVEQMQGIKRNFTDLALALSPPSTWGLLTSKSDSALFLVSQLSDRKAFQRGMAGALGALKLPAMTQLLSNVLGPVALGSLPQPVHSLKTTDDEAPHGFRLTLKIASDEATGRARTVDLLWQVHGDRVYIVLGTNSEAVLAELKAPPSHLRDQASFSQSLAGNSDKPSMALLLLGPSEASDRASMSVVLAPQQGSISVRAKLSRPMLEASIPWLSGLTRAP